MTEKEALIALNMVPNLGAITVRRLYETMGSYAAILGASEGDLTSVQGVGTDKARRFAESLKSADPTQEIARAERMKVELVTWVDEKYPRQLMEISDPPMVFYVRGDIGALSKPCVAIVGTRHPTVYGREMARKLGFQLAGAGYTVVSGLATGIDGEAHAGAVRSGGLTVGVLGGALNCFYPRENEALAREIVQRGGAVVSEYPFDREPDRQTFPMRNRIVSGVCRGVLVVESPLSSGTMITVNYALEHGKSVMAVPGRVDSPASQGCHRLIRNGAKLVTNADEVLEELQDLFCGMMREVQKDVNVKQKAEGAPPPPRPVLSEDERKVFELLTKEAQPIDSIVRTSGLSAQRVGSVLIGLQIRRLAKSLPGSNVALA